MLFVCDSLVLARGELPESGVASSAIVEDLDVLEDLAAELSLGRPCVTVDQLLLERREEALGDGVIEAVTPRAHRLCDPSGPSLLAERQRHVLAALI